MKPKQSILPLILTSTILGCSSDNPSTNNDPADGNQSDTELNLLGTAWDLKNFTAPSGNLVNVSEATKYQFLFDPQSADTEVFIGCVNYADSTYEMNDGYLTINLGSSDDVECITDTEEHSTQNNAIMSLLQGGTNGESVQLMYAVTNTGMELTSSDGRSLIFEEVDNVMQQGEIDLSQSIENTQWEINFFPR